MQALSESDREKIHAALIEGRVEDARVYMSHPGHDVPVLLWSPSEEALGEIPLIAALRAWRDLPRFADTGMPHYGDFDILSIREAMGHCVYVDVVRDEAGTARDYRYRVYGSKLSEAVGFDMTGRLLSEFPFNRRDAAVFAVAYHAVCDRREPFFTKHRPHLPNESGTWSRLTMPFAGDDGTVSRLLTTNLYALQGNRTAHGVHGFGGQDPLGSIRDDASS